MKKDITIITLFISIVAIIEADRFYDNNLDVLNSIIAILIVLILHLFKTLNYKFTKFFNTLGLIFTVVSMIIGLKGIELLLPIVVFQLIEKRSNRYINLLITTFIILILVKNNLFAIIVYNLIMNMYLFQLKKGTEDNSSLKEKERIQRYESYIMEEKIRSMDRYLEQSNLVTGLKERNFIAQKLHDKLGHRITSSIMQLEVTKETMGINDELAKKYLESAMDNLREGMDEIRGFLHTIKPRERVVSIEDIKEQLLKFEFSSGIKTRFEVSGDIDIINYKLLTLIKDNVYEALTNSAKYSKATKMDITINVYNKIVRVEVRDNGIGCKKVNKGLGLQGMEDRIEKVNGKISYYSDNGFVINMIFNLEE